MKTREDVSKIFNMILATMKTDLDINKNPDHTEMAIGFVDYLEKFGFDLAYEVLYEYLYIYPTTFFDWSKIVSLLKLKLKTQYMTVAEAKKWLRNIIGIHNKYEGDPPYTDEVLKLTVDEMGGYYAFCMSTDGFDRFEAVYSKILERTIAERMKQ